MISYAGEAVSVLVDKTGECVRNWKERVPEDTISEENPNARLVGIGGWLLVFIIRLLIVVAGDALQLSSGTFSWWVQSVTVILAALAILAAILLIARKKAGVLVGKISMLTDAALSLFGAIAGSLSGSDKTGRAFAVCLADIAFFFYLKQSVRVRNTYYAKTADLSDL